MCLFLGDRTLDCLARQSRINFGAISYYSLSCLVSPFKHSSRPTISWQVSIKVVLRPAFANLIPAKRLAKQVLDQIARGMKETPRWDPAARRYLAVKSEKEHLASNDDTGEQRSTSQQKAVKSHCTGYYDLKFTTRPWSSEVYWRMAIRDY